MIPQTIEECKNQSDLILFHFGHIGSITQKEANDLYGIERLGARIGDLRELGFIIDTVRETGKNRFGHSVSYGRYFLRSTP